jgi:hypothetical protein
MEHGVSGLLGRLQTAGPKVECMIYGGGRTAQATKDSTTWPLAKTGILPHTDLEKTGTQGDQVSGEYAIEPIVRHSSVDLWNCVRPADCEL